MESRVGVAVFYPDRTALLSGAVAGMMSGFNCRSLKLGDFEALTVALKAFRDERNWQQFHTLRNLITSLNLEAAELLELTQWKTDTEVEALPGNPESAEALRDECADILLYLLLIADKAGIDLAEAARNKLVKNAEKYPVEKAFGSRAKYTDLG
jgi:NTP pyrophosphatase (non-canonical NTP hydrolase)